MSHLTPDRYRFNWAIKRDGTVILGLFGAEAKDIGAWQVVSKADDGRYVRLTVFARDVPPMESMFGLSDDNDPLDAAFGQLPQDWDAILHAIPKTATPPAGLRPLSESWAAIANKGTPALQSLARKAELALYSRYFLSNEIHSLKMSFGNPAEGKVMYAEYV